MFFRAVPFLLVALPSFLAASCVSSIETRSAGGAAPAMSFGGQASSENESPCVMEVAGTAIDIVEVRDGVALDFATVAPDSVAELRGAARRFADEYARGVHHNHRHATRATALARAYRAHAAELPALETRVENTPEGARVFVRARNAAERARLITRVHGDVAEMSGGVCPLLE